MIYFELIVTILRQPKSGVAVS
nr:unnamed protein product [Callosobruchus analis]